MERGEVFGSDAIELLPEFESPPSAATEGPLIQVLLRIWGRPQVGIEVTDGDPEVWHQWRALPSEAFQFGAWD